VRDVGAVTEDTLRAIPLFAHVDDEALGQVAACSNEFEASAGHVLIEVGRPGAGLFILEQGTLTVELPGGKKAELGPGEFVGELALLTDAPHTARVCASTDVRCLAISRRDFADLLEEQPRVAVDMLPVLARRLVDTRRA
jgi:CRP/FNR family transcriptional regulator, cyclic AMP receptor protein